MKFSVILQRKQAIGQLFVKDVYTFPIISYRKRDCRTADLFFSRFSKALLLTSQKFYLKNWGIEYNWLTLNIVILFQFHGFIFIFMVITFLTMYNKNQFFTIHMGTTKI